MYTYVRVYYLYYANKRESQCLIGKRKLQPHRFLVYFWNLEEEKKLIK